MMLSLRALRNVIREEVWGLLGGSPGVGTHVRGGNQPGPGAGGGTGNAPVVLPPAASTARHNEQFRFTPDATGPGYADVNGQFGASVLLEAKALYRATGGEILAGVIVSTRVTDNAPDRPTFRIEITRERFDSISEQLADCVIPENAYLSTVSYERVLQANEVLVGFCDSQYDLDVTLVLK